MLSCSRAAAAQRIVRDLSAVVGCIKCDSFFHVKSTQVRRECILHAAPSPGMNNSRSFENTVEQSTTGSSLCTVNTEVEDCKIPDLNIADVSCDYSLEGIEHDTAKKEKSAGERTEGSVGRHLRQRPVEIIESPYWLPEGWTVEVRTRELGNTAGSKDKYYIEPVTGKKFRSKVEVVSYLETGSVQRWKRKSQGAEFANSSASGDDVARSESVMLVETSKPGSIGNIISQVQTSATQCAPVLSVEADTLLKKNVPTSTSANTSTKCMQVPSAQINLDNLRSFIQKGIAPPASSSMKKDSFETGRSTCVSVKDNLHSGTCSVKTPAFPYTQDYWTTALGTGASTSTNITSVPALWTNHFNSSSTYINGISSAIPSFTSTTMKTTSPLEGTPPHWLDRILNKGPSSSSSFGGITQASMKTFNFGSTGGFVQSPLHYLQNAGAFQNSWLQIKPPATISQSQTHHFKSHFDDVPWKSSLWFDDKRESLRTSAGLQSSEKQERSTINLNHPLADPDEEKRTPVVHNDHRLNQASGPNFLTPVQRYSSHLGVPPPPGKIEVSDSYMATASNGMWTPLNLPAGRMAPSASALESLWKKAVPITLEHREFIPLPNGVHGGSNFQRPERTTGGGAGKKESAHLDLGVARKSHKVDKHQEKKRLENLGKNLCQQGLTGLLQELKDRTWLRFPSDKIP